MTTIGHHTPRTPTEKAVPFGMDVDSIRRSFIRNLFCHRAKFLEVALPNDNYLALAYTVRDRLLQRWINSARTYFERASRTVAYLSAEFLIGPQLGKNLVNLGILDATGRHWTSSAFPSTLCWNRRRSRAWATGVSAAWRPATWIRWLRSRSRPSATGSVTSSASSTRRSTTAGKSRFSTAGCVWAIRGRSPIPRSPSWSRWAAVPRGTRT